MKAFLVATILAVALATNAGAAETRPRQTAVSAKAMTDAQMDQVTAGRIGIVISSIVAFKQHKDNPTDISAIQDQVRLLRAAIGH